MEWPMKNEENGKFISTPTSQSIWKSAIQPAAAEHREAVEAWVKKLDEMNENWRHGYIPLVNEFVEIQAKCSKATIFEMCRAGLDAATQSFVFRGSKKDDKGNDKSDGPMSIEQAFEECEWPPLETVSYMGGGKDESRSIFQLASPHGSDSDPLWISGKNALAQLEAWQRYGCMEPSAADHARAVVESLDASLFCRNKVFVLLGVTSEMGPARHLLKLREANVLGVARSSSKIKLLVDWFRENGSNNAKLTLVKDGADLLQQGPQIARWIVENIPQSPEKLQIVIMPLAYMDGEANCRVTVAMDSIVTYVMKRRQNVALAYLTSPSTCYTIPKDCAEDARTRYELLQGNFWSFPRLANLASLGHWLRPSDTWNRNGDLHNPILFNGVADLQGPNYCLAKTMQQWRAILSRSEGHRVAAPHAPPTRTISVVHSAEAAAGLEGLNYFPPNLAFDVQPCSSLMTAIVLHQLYDHNEDDENRGIVRPQEDQSEHPMELFWDGSVHGGSWRCPHELQSCFVVGYLLGKTIATPGWCPAEALAPRPQCSVDDV